MDIDVLQIGQVAAGAVTAATALAGILTGPGALRSRLRNDIALLEQLPPGSPAHDRLLEHIDYQVGHIAELDRNASRDIQGAIISGIMIVLFGVLGFWLLNLDDWWWRVAGGIILVFPLAGLSSMYDDLQRVPRDAKGKRV